MLKEHSEEMTEIYAVKNKTLVIIKLLLFYFLVSWLQEIELRGTIRNYSNVSINSIYGRSLEELELSWLKKLIQFFFPPPDCRFISKEVKEWHFILLSQEGNSDSVLYTSELLLPSKCLHFTSPAPNSYAEILIPKMVVLGGRAFGRWLGHNHQEGASPFRKRYQRACLPLPSSDETTRRCHRWGSQFPGDTTLTSTLESSMFKTMVIHVYCHPVCAIFVITTQID